MVYEMPERKKPNEGGKDTLNLLVDSGATSHIIVDKEKFINFEDDFNAKKSPNRVSRRQ